MDEDWCIDCSDDELKSVQHHWEPPAEEITRLYDLLDQGEIPPFKWKSPGYKSPSPDVVEQSQEEDPNKQYLLFRYSLNEFVIIILFQNI